MEEVVMKCYIKANKEGLTKMAQQLLVAADGIEQNESTPLDYDLPWIDERSDVFLQYVVQKDFSETYKTIESTPLQDKLMRWGCILGVIILLIALIIGLITMVGGVIAVIKSI